MKIREGINGSEYVCHENVLLLGNKVLRTGDKHE